MERPAHQVKPSMMQETTEQGKSDKKVLRTIDNTIQTMHPTPRAISEDNDDKVALENSTQERDDTLPEPAVEKDKQECQQLQDTREATEEEGTPPTDSGSSAVASKAALGKEELAVAPKASFVAEPVVVTKSAKTTRELVVVAQTTVDPKANQEPEAPIVVVTKSATTTRELVVVAPTNVDSQAIPEPVAPRPKACELSVEQFTSPWESLNYYHVPEIPFEEIELGERLGRGKKSDAIKAKWGGMELAVKRWRRGHSHSAYKYTHQYSQWEIQRYFDMKEIQGSLVPRLYFVSKDNDGDLLLGLELGEPARSSDKGLNEAMVFLRRKLRSHGWEQRCGSWRWDNVAWMKNDKGSRRLVAIDLESFVPFNEGVCKNPLKNSSGIVSLFGIPEISPVEIEFCSSAACIWDEDSFTSFAYNAIYQDRVVRVETFTPLKLEGNVQRLAQLSSMSTIPVRKPLFLVRLRNGTIAVGFNRYHQLLPGFMIYNEMRTALIRTILSQGWLLHDAKTMEIGFETNDATKMRRYMLLSADALEDSRTKNMEEHNPFGF